MPSAVVALGSLAVAALIGYGATTAADPPARADSPATTTGARGGGRALGFDRLAAYDYRPGLVGLPDDLRALDGARVRIRGVLLPLYQYDDIHEFTLVGSHMTCCYGYPAGLTGQVHVVLRAGVAGLPPTTEPIEVEGTFSVREETVEPGGDVLFLFQIRDAGARIAD